MRIRTDQSCLDGTVGGLLVQRNWIGATLLALLDDQQDAETP